MSKSGKDKHYDALIFDIDGTLWNASPASARGWTRGLAALGISRQITAEEIAGVTGNPYEQCIDLLLPGLRERMPELQETLNAQEAEVIAAEGGVFYEGVLDGIRALAQSYPLFLVSNCQAWYLEIFLKFSGFRSQLTGYTCYGIAAAPKHAMLATIQTTYQLQRPVYIGDTAGDEKAAATAAMDFIHAGYGFGKPQHTPPSFPTFGALVAYLTRP